MAKQPRMNAQERRWKAEGDARTLAEADVIRKTPGRMRPARGAAKRMAVEDRKAATAMTQVARGGRSRKR